MATLTTRAREIASEVGSRISTMTRSLLSRDIGRNQLTLYGVLAIVVLLAGGGAVLAAGAFSPQSSTSTTPAQYTDTTGGTGVVTGPGPFHQGQSIQTSFGVVAVNFAYVITNVDNHGGVPIQIGPALTNLSQNTITLNTDQFDVVTDASTAPIPMFADTSHIDLGQILPTVARQGSARFIVPRNAGNISVRFHDNGGAKRTIVINIGNLDNLPRLKIEGDK